MDSTKFLKLGRTHSLDKTVKAETALNGFLAQLQDSKEIREELFESLRSVGAVNP